MAADPRKPYRVLIGGLPHTLLLTAEAAQRYGDAATLVEQKKGPAPAKRTASTSRKK